MELFLDPTDGRPRSVQIYEQVRNAIVEGRLTARDRLAPTRTVAAELGVSRSTVTEAYGRLSAEGYIEGRAGGGSVVGPVPLTPTRPRQTAEALTPTPRAAGVRPYNPHPDIHATFDLRPGSVDPSLFPVAAWRRCILRALDEPPGPYGDPAGTPELRAALATWVTRSRGVTATADEVVVTSGAGHAIDLVARVLLNPGAVVAVEEPGYPPVVELLRVQGLRVVGVPVDNEGIIVDAIPSQAGLVYVTPSHQYPLAVVIVLDDPSTRATSRAPAAPRSRRPRDLRRHIQQDVVAGPPDRIPRGTQESDLAHLRNTPGSRLVPTVSDPGRTRRADRRRAPRPPAATISSGVSGAASTDVEYARPASPRGLSAAARTGGVAHRNRAAGATRRSVRVVSPGES